MGEPTPSRDATAWLEVLSRAADRVAGIAASLPPERRREPQGGGAGGDQTYLIDRMAEDAVLQELGAGPEGLSVISEEVGERDLGAARPIAVVDPIDGSLNAKRGLPNFAVSIALADGPTVADVRLGLVRDLGTGEEMTAERGIGAWSDGQPLSCAPAPARRPDLLALEGASPARVARAVAPLAGRVARIRALGSAALSVCHAGAGRVDAMAALGRCRSVDVAAAVLIAREAGAIVGLPAPGDEAEAALDLSARYHVVVGCDETTFALAREALEASASDG